MLDLNEVLISGRLAKAIEIKNFNKPDGSVGAVLKNTLAISGRTKDAPATFVDFELWNKQAEIVAQYCQKGSPLILKGELKTDSWTDQQGQKRTKIMLKASDFKLIFSNNQAQNQRPAQNVDNLGYPVNQTQAQNGFDDLPPTSGDEIPF